MSSNQPTPTIVVSPAVGVDHTSDSISLASTSSIDSQDLDAHPVARLHDDEHNVYQNHPEEKKESTNNEDEATPQSLQVDRTKTSTSTKTNRVAAKDKRGILAQVVLIPEYEDARDYPVNIKYIIVAIIAMASITGPMGTSIMLPAIDDIVSDLNTTVSMVNVSVGIYLLSLGIFPLWWSAFSEKFGRRSVYFVSFTMFVGFSIGTSLAPSIASLIVLRVLQGGCSASVQAVGAGTIADLFTPQTRGRAMGYYYLGPLMGPFLAPILGGAVAEAWGWRATQWLLVIVSGINTLLIVFGLPETLRKSDNLANIRAMLGIDSTDKSGSEEEDYHIGDEELQRLATTLSRISTRNTVPIAEDEGVIVDPVMPVISRFSTNKTSYSRKVAQEMVDEGLRRSLTHIPSAGSVGDEESKSSKFKKNLYDCTIRPLHSLVLLKHPPVALVISYSAISFAVIYFFNMTISYAYAREPYKFSSVIIGLMYIPNSLTYVIASLLGGKWNDHLLKKYAESHNGELAPESRISWNVVTAVALFPPACLIFGWTLKYGEFWFIPLIGTGIFGFASMLLIGATVTYLVDTLPGKGATGVALNNLIRQILAAVATFVVEPLLRAIGPGILFSILTGVITVSAVTLVVLKRQGPYFREHYDLGKLYDQL
ncbi:A Q resistance multidrug resistance transporter [Scheffersomyces xylosifermentans]|uniref:A Q resistance multidrug resistance transporter n=1 Tax=Scheffersomyces xylosifermentans TaxID=1304137 RepID=UPI00315C534F